MTDASSSPPAPASASAPAAAGVTTINRVDYRPPDWLVEKVHLDFDLSITATRVDATLAVRRNGAHDRPLRLDVDGTLPDALAVDGASTSYTRADGQIIVPVAAERATITLSTTIDPSANSQLMGLFASNNMLCTQCEAEGFRRIIPFVDRPDNMAVYSVRMAGDKAAFPVLLANGEQVAAGDLPGGRHFAQWDDPWPKPSYLFALVAGDLVAHRADFSTASGRAVQLAIWVRRGDEGRCAYAM
ncbi:MAG: aminopeptidase N, partial [Sphingopyxis sp.]